MSSSELLGSPLPRRAVLLGSAALAAAPILGRAASASALVRSGRPSLTHGIQAGDVTASSGTIWTRADRASQMIVEVAGDPSFRNARRLPGPHLRQSADFTGKTVLRGLPSGQDIYYRVTALDDDRASEPIIGHFRTPSRARKDITFLWSGDLAGQGWGIDTARGGYRIFEAMKALEPDFFLHNGDNIYADGPITETQALPDGSLWHNVVTPEKAKVAETLAEYRGNYKYNLLDAKLRAFYADVALIAQWDDHETRNNWYPGEILTDSAYTEKRVDVLARRARQAFHEYQPLNPSYDDEGRIYRVLHQGPLLDVFVLDMRWYRDANSTNKQTANDGGILGRTQAEWLKRELAASKATWKVLAADMPLTDVVNDATEGTANFEAIAQDDNGRPLGREIQFADIFTFLKRHDIRNVVWLTTDVHYTAAYYFDPATAAYSDFNPFWQFTTGPLHAGAFPASKVDTTFGAQTKFVKAPTLANTAPDTEYQFFGEVKIAADTGKLRVNLRDNSGAVLWSTELEPHRR
ncbi:alkaline phosphatase D family protein [Cryptosporangium sp. NPDC048952]|uniref:alkaline phosphatase D family protein n=1 Tax=Cryptosporangium sp. NPDC048952 TaxID=3363961 RepID=UPI00371785F0